MYRFIPLLLFTLVSFAVKGQKVIEIPQDKYDSGFFKRLPDKLAQLQLEDLTKTKDSLYLRIWRSNEIIEVRQQDGVYSATLTNWIKQKDPVIRKTELDRVVSERLLDSLVANNILEIPDDTYTGIDGGYVTFEVATPEKYRLYSYWSPQLSQPSREESTEDVVKLLSLTNDIIDLRGHMASFIESLEPGGYLLGMSAIRIDRFLPEHAAKSTLYKSVEERIKAKLKITNETSHRKFPIVLLDGKPAYLEDLNKLESADVKNLQILTKDDPKVSLFGTSGANGAVIVETR